MDLTLRATDAGSTTVVEVEGEVDVATASTLADGLKAIVAERDQAAASDGRRVIVDLSLVEFMDSTGIHILVDASEVARANHVGFAVARPRPTLAKALDITRANAVLEVFDSLDAAMGTPHTGEER